VSVVKVLPELRSGGGAQMALDEGLLETADAVIARKYTWAPPALSIGKFQALEVVPGLPFDVVRRPSGGRAVLHGEAFEWSFAVAFPPGLAGGGRDVATPYDLVAIAFAAAFEELGVKLDGDRESPYQRSALCFASALRHDLLSRGEKLVAIAQARRGGRALVHGSVLMQRPPRELTDVVEALTGEPWQGEGLAGAGVVLAPATIWRRALALLDRELRGISCGAPSGETRQDARTAQ
jgi:lipoate-protein ligase A